MLTHDVDERERVADVVAVVLDGLGHGLAHGLVAGEVDHAVDAVRVEDTGEGLAVVDVGDIEGEVRGRLGADDGLDAIFHLGGGVGEIIDDDDLVSAFKQLDDGVRADEAGAAGDEDAGVLRSEGLSHAIAPFMGMFKKYTAAV